MKDFLIIICVLVVVGKPCASFANSDMNLDERVSYFGDPAEHPDAPSARVQGPIDDGSFENKNPNRFPASAEAPRVQAKAEDTIPLLTEAQRQAAVQEVSLISNDEGFFPRDLVLTRGIPVRIFATAASNNSQCFMMDQFKVERQLKKGKIEEIAFTPETIGTFEFSCPMNGAKGHIIVKNER